jgi:hypothetical protein
MNLRMEMKRKMIIGGLAAVMVLGSAGLTGTVHTAWAAEDTTITLEVVQKQSITDVINQRIKNIVEDAAFVSWMEQKDVEAALADGDNLLEATGLRETELMGRLAQLAYSDINAALADDTITAAQADQLKADAARKLHAAINADGYTAKSVESYLNLLQASIIEEAAVAAGLDLGEVQQSLSNGSNLVSATGLSSTELSTQLQKDLNSKIDSAAARSELSAEEAASAKEQIASFLEESISKNGFAVQKEYVDVTALVAARLDTIIEDTASAADLETDDVEYSLSQGSNLADASRLGEDTLQAKLEAKINNDLDNAVARGEISADTAEAAKADASKQIQKIIVTNGYQKERAPADYSGIILKRIKSVYEDTAEVADKSAYDLKYAVKAGASLAEASGLTEQELLSGLISFVQQDISSARNSGKLTDDEVVQANEEALKQLEAIVGVKGYVNEREAADYSYVVYDRLNSIVKDAADKADLTQSELQYALGQGESLEQATGFTSAELLHSLLHLVSLDINELRSYDRINTTAADELKALAAEKLELALK